MENFFWGRGGALSLRKFSNLFILSSRFFFFLKKPSFSRFSTSKRLFLWCAVRAGALTGTFSLYSHMWRRQASLRWLSRNCTKYRADAYPSFPVTAKKRRVYVPYTVHRRTHSLFSPTFSSLHLFQIKSIFDPVFIPIPFSHRGARERIRDIRDAKGLKL